MISSAIAFIAAAVMTAVLTALSHIADDDKRAMAAYPAVLFTAVVGLAAIASPQVSACLLCAVFLGGAAFIAVISGMFEDDTVNGIGLAMLGVVYAILAIV